MKLEHSELAEPRRVRVRSVDDARYEIERRMTPTLRRAVARRLATLYAHATRQARRALLDHPEPEAAAAVRESYPWTLDQLRAEDWYPTNRHGSPSPELP